MLLILTIITIAAATLSLLAFLAVLRLPKAVMNVVQQVNAERTAERQQAVAVECIYRDYLGYSNVMALITTPMEVGTAKEQTLASVRKVVGGAHLDYYYKHQACHKFCCNRAIRAAGKASRRIQRLPYERGVAEWHAFLKYARYASDYNGSEQVKRLAGMSAELWEEISVGLDRRERNRQKIEADGRSVQILKLSATEQATDWMKRHIGKM